MVGYPRPAAAPTRARSGLCRPHRMEAQLLATVCATLIVVGAAAQVNDWRTYLPQVDFSAYYLAGRALNEGSSPYADANREQLGELVPPTARRAWIPYLYPPSFAATMRVAAAVPYRWIAPAWLFANTCVLALAYSVLWRMYAPRRALPAAVALSMLAPPSLSTLALGQVNPVILLCLAAALREITRARRPMLCGAWVGLAASIKVFPFALPFALRNRDRRYAIVAAGMILAMFCVLGLLAGGGLRAFEEWPRVVASATSRLEGLAENQSLAGVMSRWSASHGVLAAASANRVRMLTTGTIGLLSVVAFLPLGRRRPARIDVGLRWSILLLAACITLPLAWDHYYVLLVLPVAGLLRAAPPGSVVWRVGALGLLCVLAQRYARVLVAAHVPGATALGLAGCVLLWTACLGLFLVRGRRRLDDAARASAASRLKPMC